MLHTACDVITITEIEREHALLWDRLAHFYELLPCLPGEENCGACAGEKQSECQGILEDYLVDLLVSMQRHFEREDAAMRHPDSPHRFDAHVDDHADIIERFGKVVSASPLPCGRAEIRELVEHLLKEHSIRYDAPLLAWLRQQTRPVPG